MNSLTHILVPSGKADADAIECKSSFVDQIESLRSEQIHLSQQLLAERNTNSKVRKDLAFAEQAYLECSHKRNISAQTLAQTLVQHTKLQLTVAELQKALHEEEFFVARVMERISELQQMNETATESLKLNSQRTAQFHLRLAGYSTVAPVHKDSETMSAELARLRQENHSLKSQLSKMDVRLIEVAEKAEEEKKELELAVAEAKARLAALKVKLSETETVQFDQLKQLKTSLEVQLAHNDALQAEIQASERRLFGGADAAWPEL